MNKSIREANVYKERGNAIMEGVAIADLTKEHFEKAEPEFRKALEYNLDDVDARLSLAMCLGHKGKIDEIIRLLEEVIQLDPDNPAHADLGRIYDSQGRYAEAAHEYKEALRVFVDDPERRLLQEAASDRYAEVMLGIPIGEGGWQDIDARLAEIQKMIKGKIDSMPKKEELRRIDLGPKPDYQSVGIRFAATLIDGIIIFIGMMILSAICSFVEMKPIEEISALSKTSIFIFFPLAYYIILEGMKGATLGKKLCGIRVEKVGGTPCDMPSAIVRNLLRLVDGFLGYLVGAIIIWNSDKKQRLGDMIANTVVIKSETYIEKQEDIKAEFANEQGKTFGRRISMREYIALNKQAHDLADAGRYQEALSVCQRLLEGDSDPGAQATVYSTRATIFRQMGKLNEAIDDFSRTIQYHDDSGSPHFAVISWRAKCYEEAGQKELSIRDWERIAQADVGEGLKQEALQALKRLQPEETVEEMYKCVRCGKEFRSKDNLIEYPGNQVVCKQCDAELDQGVMQDFKFVTHSEKDNMGTRQDTMDQAVAYWMARNAGQKFEPYVLYVFDGESDAREALLELDCIHLAEDTGKLICTETLTFGYYRRDDGKHEAIVCGEDLSHELWAAAKDSFAKHGGQRKNDQEPEKGAPATPETKKAEPDKVTFVREDHQQVVGEDAIYRIHKGPDAASAKAFLEHNPVTRKFYYIVVETPEGNYCRDIQGIYKE